MIEFSDSSFDSSQAYTYTLSIRRLSGGFCFAIFNSEKRLLYFLHTEGKPESFDFLKQRYAAVYLLDDSAQYTLVPRPAFREDLKEMFWNVNFKPVASSDSLSYDMVRLTDVVNLYAPSVDMKRSVEALFSQSQNIKVVHRQSVQMTVAVMRNKQANCKQIFIQMMEDSFDLLLMDKGNVILANTYPCRTDDEMLYYVLNIFNQMKIDPYSTKVLVGGSSDGHEIGLFSQYLENVSPDAYLQRPLPESFVEREIPSFAYALLELPLAVN